ncbi:branched-chain amino acid ABC transporter substrate-binding protein [Trinickia sp.]|uniref:branched-chain amino acid ABC transporter substrate-binding protein n=1 Tax=Trinickia sp. TaxID=2571163 RepID=UPI003F7CF37B
MTVGHASRRHAPGRRRHAPFSPRRLASFSFAALIVVAFTLTSVPYIAQAQDAIKIGVPTPLSGAYRDAGTDIFDGAQLAANQINAAGGVLGKKLELVQQDDACNPDKAATAASELVSAKVAAVAGGYCSSAALPELNVLHEAGIPYVLDASTSPQLTEHGWTSVFRTIGRADAQGGYVASFMSGVLHAKSAAVINDGSTYSQGLAQDTIAALKRNGIVVVYDAALTPGQRDYRDIAVAAGHSKPDVLYFTGYYPEAAALAKDIRALGLPIKSFMSSGTADPSLIQTGGAAVEGMIVTTSPLPAFFKSERAHQFSAAYEAAYKRGPGPYSIYEYDAIGVTAQAIKNAKSTKPADIVTALHALKSFNGATGKIAFDEKGDRASAAYMAVEIRHGKFDPYASLDGKGRWVLWK